MNALNCQELPALFTQAIELAHIPVFALEHAH